MAIIMQCDHQNVYFGVVNLRYQNQTVGAIDAWRCVRCKQIFCEEKQLGILDISSEIGMPKIGPYERWAILICSLKTDKARWALIRVKKEGEIKHSCVDKEESFIIENYRVQNDKHWTVLVDESINKEIEID